MEFYCEKVKWAKGIGLYMAKDIYDNTFNCSILIGIYEIGFKWNCK